MLIDANEGTPANVGGTSAMNPTKAGSPARPWLQFSLRTLLIATLLIAVACGLFAKKLNSARRQALAVAELRKAAVDVVYEYQRDGADEPYGPPWLRQWFGDDVCNRVVGIYVRLDDQGNGLEGVFDHLLDLPDVEQFLIKTDWGYRGTYACSDTEIAKLGRLKKLNDVYLDGACSVTDRGVEHLCNLTNLETLRLPASDEITDKSLELLSRLPSLRSLTLLGSNVTGSGLVHLRKLTELETLNLAWTIVNDGALKHMAALPQLRVLILSDTPITNQGLVHLSAMPQLEHLTISRTAVTDDGIAHLAGLSDLRWLDTDVSPTALVHLRRLTGLVELPFRDGALPFAVPKENVHMLAELTQLWQLRLADDVTDAELVHLRRLVNLNVLDLSGARGVTGSGLVHLSGLTKLHVFHLDGTSVDDAGLVHLAMLPQLESICLMQTRVSPDGVAKLRQKLPNTHVSY